jgi:hypothetical protein
MKTFILFEGIHAAEFRCVLWGPEDVSSAHLKRWYDEFAWGCRAEETIPTMHRFVDYLVKEKGFKRVETEEVYLP